MLESGERENNLPLIIVTILLAAGIFVLDLSIPLGFAGGVPYVLLILLTLFSTQRGNTYILAILVSVLTLLGFFLSPPGGNLATVLLNRFLALFLIWMTAILTLQSRKTTEESEKTDLALQASEARYRALVQTVGSVILLISPDHKILEFNQEAERIYGRRRESVLGKDYFELFLPETVWEDVAADIRKVLAGEPTRGFENPVLAADGKERILLWNVVRMLDDQGEPSGFIACGQDITDLKQTEKELRKAKDGMEQRVSKRTAELLQANKALETEIAERKRAEEALRHTEAQFRLLVDHSPDVIMRLDREGRILFINNTLPEYTVDDVLGTKVYNYISAEDGRRYKQLLDKVFNSGEPDTLELRAAGPTVWLTRLAPIWQQDKVESALVIATDITALKEGEQQLKQSLKEKEVLLQEVHHRVKNNLQIISSLLNLQSNTIMDQTAVKALLESRQRIKSMALIHEILYQSKDLTRVHFAQYIRTLTTQLISMSHINPGRVTQKLDCDGLLLDIDTAIPCGMIINELISNALKHAFPAGEQGEFGIALHSDDHQVHLTISDNGIGLPKDLDFRNTASLGLQLVNRLTSQLKGTIKYESKGGSTWKITFPKPQER